MPHYLAGRKVILFVQSLVYPLQTLNERFVAFAKEKLIEANMTSQVLYFEWFLNRKLGAYLADPQDRIFIRDSTVLGVDLYHEDSAHARPFTVWYQGEQVAVIDPREEPRPFYFRADEKAVNRVGFMVCVSRITIPEHELVNMLSHYVNLYKIAGKTYLIRIDQKEITPNTQLK